MKCKDRQGGWGTFELDTCIHVMPCDAEGYALPPHVADLDCFCEPIVLPDTFSLERCLYRHFVVPDVELPLRTPYARGCGTPPASSSWWPTSADDAAMRTWKTLRAALVFVGAGFVLMMLAAGFGLIGGAK